MHRNWAPLASYLAVEILLLVMLRFTPANGVWFLLSGFLAIGFVGAILFREHPLDNSKALIMSSGIVPPAVKEALQHNLAANLFGAILNAVAAMCTSWMVCVLLAIVGNTFGAKVRRLVFRPS